MIRVLTGPIFPILPVRSLFQFPLYHPLLPIGTKRDGGRAPILPSSCPPPVDEPVSLPQPEFVVRTRRG